MSDDSNLCIPEDLKSVPDNNGIGFLLLQSLRKFSNNILQIDSTTGMTMAFDEFLKLSVSVAQEIKRRGITESDVISICSENSMHNWLPVVACFFLGVKSCSLDPALSESDTVIMLTIVKPKMIFCSSKAESLIVQSVAAAGLNVDIIIFDGATFSSFLVHKETKTFQARIPSDIFETAILLFSSGSTGNHKAICLSHYSLLYHMKLRNQSFSNNLVFSTTFWISTISFLLQIICSGETRIVCSSFKVKKLFDDIENFKINYLLLSPILSYKVTQYPENCKRNTSSLKLLIIGGGPVDKVHIDNLRLLFPHTSVINGYGMTEHSGPVLNRIRDRELYLKNSTTCGKPQPGVCYKVVDVVTNDILGFNAPGELRIKSKCVMNGYYNDPEETSAAFDEQGFFKTGDVVHYDEDYCFYVVDRVRNMLKYQMWHVNPSAIESVILSHPDVCEAVVIGIPHAIDGEHPLGVVKLKPDAAIEEEELVQFVNARLENRKHIRAGIKYVDEIPKTSNGKYLRRVVKSMCVKL